MAAGDVKNAYQAVQTMTVTNLQSLASSATGGWQSDVVDNTSNLFIDAIVQVVLKTTNSGSIANDKAGYVYAYGGLDTTYTNPASGSEGAITLTDPTGLRLIDVIPLLATDTVYEGQPVSVARAFGGVLPPKWGIVVRNYCGIALAATSGSTVTYRGLYNTVAQA